MLKTVLAMTFVTLGVMPRPHPKKPRHTDRSHRAVEPAPPETAGPVQQLTPEGEAALSSLMASMDRRAEEVIARARTQKGSDADARYRQAALEIYCIMRPRFGPANAWLFNRRDHQLAALHRALKMPAEAAGDPTLAFYEQACEHLESLTSGLRAAGLDVAEPIPASRRGLGWSDAEGFTLTLRDLSTRVSWRPPYAGTVAGPDVPASLRHPQLTLFVFVAREGTAYANMVRREQPGDLWFYTGALLGYTLQEPQSHDVSPSDLIERVTEVISRAGLPRRPSREAVEALCTLADAGPSQCGLRDGVLWVTTESDPPKALPASLRGAAVLWTQQGGIGQVHHLRLP